MWRSLVAIFINPVVWHRFIKWAEKSWKIFFLEVVFGVGGMVLGTVIWIILFFVCLIGWILARIEYNKFNKLSTEKDMEREREREEVMNNPPILEQ
jgi:cobalamin biosynthesis protein CobD/CbiB